MLTAVGALWPGYHILFTCNYRTIYPFRFVAWRLQTISFRQTIDKNPRDRINTIIGRANEATHILLLTDNDAIFPFPCGFECMCDNIVGF